MNENGKRKLFHNMQDAVTYMLNMDTMMQPHQFDTIQDAKQFITKAGISKSSKIPTITPTKTSKDFDKNEIFETDFDKKINAKNVTSGSKIPMMNLDENQQNELLAAMRKKSDYNNEKFRLQYIQVDKYLVITFELYNRKNQIYWCYKPDIMAAAMALEHSPIKTTTEMQQSESFNYREEQHGNNQPKIANKFEVKGLYIMFTCPVEGDINDFIHDIGKKLKNFCIHDKFPSLYLTMLHMNKMHGISNRIDDTNNDFWTFLRESPVEVTSYNSLDALFLNTEIIYIMKKAYSHLGEELTATMKWTQKMKEEAFRNGKLPTDFPKFI